MRSNRGATTLKSRRRNGSPMQEFDRLLKELRLWVAGAMLPWRARSVQRAYDKALARTGDAKLALQELDRIQMSMVSKDAAPIWGDSHPNAAPQ